MTHYWHFDFLFQYFQKILKVRLAIYPTNLNICHYDYRPISCLVTTSGSKVLEKIVCDQLTKFLEDNSLLPENQHGFRSNRSTVTALSQFEKVKKKSWVKPLNSINVN